MISRRGRTIWSAAAALAVAGLFVQAQTPSKPVTAVGLEMSVATVERVARASLNDCPPGANSQAAMTKPGEEMAVVTVAFKVTSSFKPQALKRPVLTDAAGKTFNTAVSFVDVGAVLEFSCAFPFRVPTGARLKSIQIGGASLDLTDK